MSYQHKCNAQLTIPTETARKPPQQTKKRGAATIETAPGEFAKDSFGDTLRTTSRSTPRRKPQTSKNTAPEQLSAGGYAVVCMCLLAGSGWVRHPGWEQRLYCELDGSVCVACSWPRSLLCAAGTHSTVWTCESSVRVGVNR
jgi:hypothetical protein